MTVHRFAYMTEPAREDELRPHELRDGDAYCRLLPAMIELGHKSGPPLINHPLSEKAKDTSLADLSFPTEDDLLVLTSRPPLDDRKVTGGPKVSKASKTQFEGVLFKTLTNYLRYCSRSQITLHPDQAALLLPHYENRNDLDFFVKPNEKKARYESSYSLPAGGRGYAHYTPDRTTAAYLIHTPPLPMPDGRKGPHVLVSFGLSGTIGYVFAHQLCEQKRSPFRGLLEDILRVPWFAMVEITVTSDVPSFYTTLDFSDEWDYKLITRPAPGVLNQPAK